MATKRMISLQIADTDAFLDMPATSQLLYFHLTIRADDEGFVDNPKKISRIVGVQNDDLKVLIAKRFVLDFKNGVVVIKHWLIHNNIRMDRFNKTVYQDEKNGLAIKENKSYTELTTKKQPVGNQASTLVKLSKVKLREVKLSKAKLSYAEKDKILTNLLYSLIKENYPFLKEKDYSKDYAEMNKLHKIDNWNYDQIEYIIKWSQQDNFWKQNIRSVSKLRKQFESLIIKAKQNSNQIIKT